MVTCNPPEECAYCRSPIVSGERWVREKIYEPTLVGQDPRYHPLPRRSFHWRGTELLGKTSGGSGDFAGGCARRVGSGDLGVHMPPAFGDFL